MIRAYKFNDWNIPGAGRVNVTSTPFKVMDLDTFRVDGAISSWGDSPPTIEPVDVTQSFAMFSLLDETTLEAELSTMRSALAVGPGKLYFAPLDPASAPETYVKAFVRNLEVQWETNLLARVNIVWHLTTPMRVWAMTAQDVLDSVVDYDGSAETIAANVWGESWEERVAAVWDVTSSPFTFELTNPGERRNKPVLRLEGPFTDPLIENLTNGQTIQLTGSGGGASDIWQVNAANNAHGSRSSSDSGATWANVWPSTALATDQGPVFELEVGANDIRITGASGGRILIVQRPVFLL
jgi:hypothetical protein